MKARLQTKNGRPYSVASMLAVEGFIQRGYEISPFDIADIDHIEWQRAEPVIGGVGTCRRILEHLKVNWMRDTYPIQLRNYLQRKISTCQLGELKSEEFPVFIKPKLDTKTFTGFVCKDKWDRRLGNLPSDLDIYRVEVVDFLTEYRVYVMDGKILNIARYTGKVDHTPNVATIRCMINDMYTTDSEAPISYSLDVGVLSTGDTALVEVNDALSLGNYGLCPALHSKMISARWLQLVGLHYLDDADTNDSPSYINAN